MDNTERAETQEHLAPAPPPSQGPVVGKSSVMYLLAAVALAAALAFLAIWLLHNPRADFTQSAADDKLPVLFDAPKFEMTAENGQPFASPALAGKVWVANFIFTNCQGPCPMMTKQIAALEDRVTSEAVQFVSFTVDPERDTPEVLAEYEKRNTADNADAARWRFLTAPGTSYLDIAEGFRVMAKPADGSHPILHSEKFFLVDGAGKVRGTYTWNDPASIDRLVADAAVLATPGG